MGYADQETIREGLSKKPAKKVNRTQYTKQGQGKDDWSKEKVIIDIEKIVFHKE